MRVPDPRQKAFHVICLVYVFGLYYYYFPYFPGPHILHPGKFSDRYVENKGFRGEQ